MDAIELLQQNAWLKNMVGTDRNQPLGSGSIHAVWTDWCAYSLPLFFKRHKEMRQGMPFCQTLIMHGRRDRISPYVYAEELHSKIENSELVTFSGGHFFLFLEMKRFCTTLAKFLLGNEKAPAAESW